MKQILATIAIIVLLPIAVHAITAEALFSAYKDNEVAADQQYKGKNITITGTVKSIGKDLLKIPYVTLTTSNPFLSVQCMFTDKDVNALARLSKGDAVTISGTVKGSVINILVEECKLH